MSKSCMLTIKQSTGTEAFAHIIRGTGSIDTLPQCSRRMEEVLGRKEDVAGRKEEDEVADEQEGEVEEVGGCSDGG